MLYGRRAKKLHKHRLTKRADMNCVVATPDNAGSATLMAKRCKTQFCCAACCTHQNTDPKVKLPKFLTWENAEVEFKLLVLLPQLEA